MVNFFPSSIHEYVKPDQKYKKSCVHKSYHENTHDY